MYVKRNIQTGLLNHCCRGKALNIKYYECASVFLSYLTGMKYCNMEYLDHGVKMIAPLVNNRRFSSPDKQNATLYNHSVSKDKIAIASKCCFMYLGVLLIKTPGKSSYLLVRCCRHEMYMHGSIVILGLSS
jgi:hypothetical protein